MSKLVGEKPRGIPKHPGLGDLKGDISLLLHCSKLKELKLPCESDEYQLGEVLHSV